MLANHCPRSAERKVWQEDMAEQPALDRFSAEHLLALLEIAHTLNSSLDFNDVLNRAMDSVMRITKAERGVLMIADGPDAALSIRVARGLDGAALAAEDAYSSTIVKQVVATRETLLTNNAMLDPRYTPGQSIIVRGLRAILCAPMVVKDRLVGLVYVDTSMRSGAFSEADRDLLTAVAAQAGVAIENARLYALAVEKGRLERELQMAREIQEALLPRRLPRAPGYDVSAVWHAAREMAGDFYDAFALDSGALGIVVADVSDKGAPAALFMAAARSFIRGQAFAGHTPLVTLELANDLMVEDSDSGMFVTACYSVFYPDGRCVSVNAGHNPPLLYRHADRTVHLLPRGGRALGWFKANPLAQIALNLEPGDMLIYYTDGLIEAEDRDGAIYSVTRLEQVVLASAGLPAEAVLEHIIADVECFCAGRPLADDLTVVVVRFEKQAEE